MLQRMPLKAISKSLRGNSEISCIGRAEIETGQNLPGFFFLVHNRHVSEKKQPEKLPIQRRGAKVEVSGYDPEKRTVEFALSSEEPVERYYGNEILDHSESSIDASRLQRGIPLLYNHDPNQHIGTVTDYRIADKRLIVTAKFGNSAVAKEKEQDVRDGILKDASVGYRPMEYKSDGGDKSGDTYRWIKWQPMEASLVPVPADPTVGTRAEDSSALAFPVRCLDVEELKTAVAEPKTEVRSMSTETKPVEKTVAEVGADAAKVERTRVSEIHALAQRHGTELTREQAEKFVNDGATVDAVRSHILDKQIEIAQTNEVRNLNVLGLSDKDKQRYSVVAALRAATGESIGPKDGAFEKEVSDAFIKATGRSQKEGSIVIPMDVQMSAAAIDRQRGVATRTGLDSSSGSTGSNVIFTEYVSLIELLRNQMKVRALGATFLSGLSSNVAFPKQATAGSASWVADNPGADVADSNLTLAQISLTPKILQSSTAFSRKLLLQSSVDVEALVRNDLMAIMALAIDLASLTGTGANNQPLGVLNQSGIGSVVTAGATLTFDDFLALEELVADANADQLGIAAQLTTPKVRRKLKNLPQLANTIALPVWQDDEVNGYRTEVTNQLPTPLSTGGTPYAQHTFIHGIWSQVLIGEWGALEVITDPYRLKKQGMIEVTTYETCDVNVRHPQAFSAMTDINPTA